ncbi:MAG: HD domain-containing protein [Candidatus Nealsonbacteria bacterium]|nr:HD domain-containing protein [Candidatus Nealsonbacteria bacterium]
MKKKEIEKLTSFLFEMGTLRKIIRMHQQALLASDPSDNISTHTFRTVVIGYFLAKELKADADKVIKMCLLHDIEETRCGDQNWVHKRYVKVFEEEIRKDQLKNLPHSEELLDLSKEYQERKTLEAKIAKDADRLDEILLLREYELQGNKEASSWLRENNENEKRLFTEFARQISEEIKKQNPSRWWSLLWTPDRRK